MTTKERVKAVLDERGIAVSVMEKACGFSNGWFSGLRRGTISNDKLNKIAEYLGLSVEFLSTGETTGTGYYLNPETAALAQEMYEDPDMRSLFDMKRRMNPERFQTHMNYMKELYRQEHPDYDDGC